MKTSENVIYYKCNECGDKIPIGCGQTKEPQVLNMTDFNETKCPQCNTIMKIQDKERWTIENNKITKEKI